jgi:hypothetical protein
MYRTVGVFATTHVDLHHERFALSAIEGMAEQIAQNYIPFIWNHDIRFPPIGRVVSARIVELPDGEFGLETESECWEAGDSFVDLAGDGRSIVREEFDEPGFQVRIDRRFRSVEDRLAAEDLARLAGADRPPIEVGKKALDPDAVLTIAFGVIVGEVATGIFQRLGADIYDQLKGRLARFVEERKEPFLIHFDITFERDGR